jgi:hypothetical protein
LSKAFGDDGRIADAMTAERATRANAAALGTDYADWTRVDATVDAIRADLRRMFEIVMEMHVTFEALAREQQQGLLAIRAGRVWSRIGPKIKRKNQWTLQTGRDAKGTA